MRNNFFLHRLPTSVLGAALALVWMTTAGLAQMAPIAQAPTDSQYVLRIQSPTNGAGAAGAVTGTGRAVDCATGQPATRVALYDGPNLVSSAYLADVSMDTT